MRYLFLFLILIVSFNVNAKEVDILRIIDIESGFDEGAHNISSGARGMCQITPVVLRDFNEQMGTYLTLNDLYKIYNKFTWNTIF